MIWQTFKDGHEVPDGNPSGVEVLSQRYLQQEEGYSTEYDA